MFRSKLGFEPAILFLEPNDLIREFHDAVMRNGPANQGLGVRHVRLILWCDLRSGNARASAEFAKRKFGVESSATVPIGICCDHPS